LTGIIWGGGDAWRTVRRFTIRTLRDFGFGKKTNMQIVMKRETEAALQEIRATIIENNGIWDVNTHILSTFTLNVLWSLVGGRRIDHNDESIEEILRLSDMTNKIAGSDNIDNVFPGVSKWFPWLVPRKLHMDTHRGLQAWIQVC